MKVGIKSTPFHNIANWPSSFPFQRGIILPGIPKKVFSYSLIKRIDWLIIVFGMGMCEMVAKHWVWKNDYSTWRL